MAEKSKDLVLRTTLIVFLIIIPSIYALFFASNLNPFSSWKHQESIEADEGIGLEKEPLEFLMRRLMRGEDREMLDATGFSCNSDLHSDLCVTHKPVWIDNGALKVHIQSDDQVNQTIKPYARKEDPTAMKEVTPIQILATKGNDTPPCTFTHNVPAVIFSSGGFTGNLFHEFNEIIIPLFITCRHFRSHLRFVITDMKPWWVSRYNKILSHLSRYDVLDLDSEPGSVHCFPGSVVGLKYHDNLALNTTAIPGGYSMFEFRHFLREAYSLNIKTVTQIKTSKPVLMLVSRKNSRRFLNEDEMMRVMAELGFEVIMATPDTMSNLDEFASVVNSCSVMVGAHGAGLTNAVFLPGGAVMVQVVPLELDWASSHYFGEPVRKMGVEYLEYKIEAEESSLFHDYGPDHPVIADPGSIISKGYYAFRAVYVDGQNFNINLTRFRRTLVEALRLVSHSTPSN